MTTLDSILNFLVPTAAILFVIGLIVKAVGVDNLIMFKDWLADQFSGEERQREKIDPMHTGTIGYAR